MPQVAEPEMRAPVPGTDKLLQVEHIIRVATHNGETPISLNEIKRRMGVAIRHSQVRDLINVLLYMGRISEEKRGVEFSYMDPAAYRRLGPVKL